MADNEEANLSRFSELMGELDAYLPAATQNQALLADGPTGVGTLKGFHAKVAEVFRLGQGVGWDKAMAEKDVLE